VPGRVVGTGGLVNPLSVREQVERAPQDRPQNVPVAITPRALVGFDYYPWSFVTNFLARYLSVWGFPWWLAAPGESAPVGGAFSLAYSSAFDGGAGSPTGPAFSTAFSNAFS
jgi:hypothetical protein